MRRLARNRLAVARYRATEKGEATRTRYEHSEKGKATYARYDSSPKGKLKRWAYNHSPRGVESRRLIEANRRLHMPGRRTEQRRRARERETIIQSIVDRLHNGEHYGAREKDH